MPIIIHSCKAAIRATRASRRSPRLLLRAPVRAPSIHRRSVYPLAVMPLGAHTASTSLSTSTSQSVNPIQTNGSSSDYSPLAQHLRAIPPYNQSRQHSQVQAIAELEHNMKHAATSLWGAEFRANVTDRMRIRREAEFKLVVAHLERDFLVQRAALLQHRIRASEREAALLAKIQELKESLPLQDTTVRPALDKMLAFVQEEYDVIWNATREPQHISPSATVMTPVSPEQFRAHLAHHRKSSGATSSFRAERWPCDHGYSNFLPAEPLLLSNKPGSMGFTWTILEEILHKALTQRTEEFGLASAPVYLVNSPFVTRTACCPLEKNGKCYGARSYPGKWQRMLLEYCKKDWCPIFVTTVGWAFDTQGIVIGVNPLVNMPVHLRRNVLIFTLDDEVPGAHTATLEDVLGRRNLQNMAVVAAPYPTLALEHVVRPDKERDILVLCSFWTRTWGRSLQYGCNGCPDFFGSLSSHYLREALAKRLLSTPGGQRLERKISGATFDRTLGTGLFFPKIMVNRSNASDDLAEAPNLADRSEFCLEPPGDTPTRSHLYLSIMSGCIPVIFDGMNETVRNHKLAPFGPRWAWRSSRDGTSLFRPLNGGHVIDFNRFTVVFDQGEVRRDPDVVLRRLRAIAPRQRRELRAELMRVRGFFGYRSSSKGVDAADAVASVIREFVAART